MHAVLHFLHLAAVVIWVGGMFFAHVILRPAIAELPPNQRLPLMLDILGRFFAWVSGAVAIILVSGFGLIARTGFAAAPPHWHAMAGIGLAMALIFADIRLRLFPSLRTAVAAADGPRAAPLMAAIRLRVLINLILGGLTLAVATLGGRLG